MTEKIKYLDRLGKILPQAKDLEEVVLGAMLLETDGVQRGIELLVPGCFYVGANNTIYEIIIDFYQRNKKIDILTICEELKRKNKLEKVGGQHYLTVLTRNIASTAHLEEHCAIIMDKYTKRELIRVASTIIGESYEDVSTAEEIISFNSKELTNLIIGKSESREKTTTELFKDFKEKIALAKKNHESGILTGVPTTLKDLDKVTSGWQEGDLIIIAGRTSMGKTSLTKAIINGAVERFNKPVAMFSLEMNKVQLIARLVSERTGITSQSYMRGNWHEQTSNMNIDFIESIYKHNGRDLLIIDDTSNMPIGKMIIRMKRINQIYDPVLFIIDYLQLSSVEDNKGKNREQEISIITRSLKQFAKDTTKPVIAVAQLNRALELRGGSKRPQLSDLRDSGSIEMDSDVVVFIYRPEYYGIKEYKEGEEHKGDSLSTDGVAELIIAKHRNGALKTVFVKFIDRLTKFTNWDEVTEEEAVDDLPF